MIDLSHIQPPTEDGLAKYLDTPRWLAVCDQRVRRLGLDVEPPRRVLDLGCGCGYFLHVCRNYGHEVLGLDRVGREAFYRDVTAALGAPVVEEDVRPFVSLPDLGRFDAITAYMITFNGHRTPQLWDVAEWRFFLDDLERRLNPGGVIALEMNREPSGRCYTRDLVDFFRSRGAVILRHRVTFRR
jgi:SAM-dependent methyltransferase